MLKGIIPAVIVPMDSSFKIDFDEYKKYLKWIRTSGANAVAVNVDTGEGPTLTPQERVEVIRAARSALPDAMIVAGIIGSSTASAVESAKQAKEAGANAGLVFPNTAFMGQPLDPEAPVQYHRELSEKADLDIILFQLQSPLGGIEYSNEVLMKLAALKKTIAIKEALFDGKKFDDTLRLFKHSAPNVPVLTGNDKFIYESFVLGCDGALIGFGALDAKDLVDSFELVQQGKIKEGLEIRDKFQYLAETIFAPPVRNYRARTKFALGEIGRLDPKLTYVRAPLLQINEEDKAIVRKALKTAGL